MLYVISVDYKLYAICYMLYVICHILWTGAHNGNQQIILPQIGLAQNQIKNNAIQEDPCVLETPYRETTVFGSHDPNTAG